MIKTSGTSLQLKVQAIGGDGYHLITTILVNGISARMVVDTGASRTVFDKVRIESLEKKRKRKLHNKLSSGLGTNSMESHLITLGEIQLGKFKIRKYKSVLLDLSHVNNSYLQLDLKPVEGVIGSDILKKYRAVIDFRKKKLFLKK